MLTDETIQLCLTSIVNAELHGLWPAVTMFILYVPIPKSDGGRRAIGLITALIRCWARMRKPYMQTWKLKHRRAYNWASQGTSSEQAVWCQSVRIEAAKQDNEFSATVLLDLVKAYEFVQLWKIWAAATKLRAPPDVLRMELEAYCGLRLIFEQGVVSNVCVTHSAIVVGGRFATDSSTLR